MISAGTGFEKSSYSLQYVQARLQRRMGMMWAITGWSVDSTPLASIRHSLNLRLSARLSRRNLNPWLDITGESLIEPHSAAAVSGYGFFGSLDSGGLASGGLDWSTSSP